MYDMTNVISYMAFVICMTLFFCLSDDMLSVLR